MSPSTDAPIVKPGLLQESHGRNRNSEEMAAATTLQTPLGRRVKVIEKGTGTPVVFLHSGVGSAGEWKQVFSLWPEGYRLSRSRPTATAPAQA